MLRSVGLVVADELQMMADRERGPNLEMLLTRIKLDSEGFQLIGLSAVLNNSDVLSRWLGARFLEHYQRPVELRQGILYRGSFRYETYNSGEPGEERMGGDVRGPADQILPTTAAHLARQGEQSLVFLADKHSTRVTAQAAAQQYDGDGAADAMEELSALEETHSGYMLRACLARGVAFHNADLSWEERHIVERHFRRGAIRIICSTPTLALGVNLPAKNVLLEPTLWDSDGADGPPHRRHLTKAEYDNMSGRAGRLEYEADMGRSIIVAATKLECQTLHKRYLEADCEELEPQLRHVDLATHAMNLVAGRAARSERGIGKFLAHTLTGLLHWRNLYQHRGKFYQSVARAVEQCVDWGLLVRTGETLQATNLGKLCATKGVGAGTGNELASWLRAAQGRDLCEAEAVYALARTDEARAYHVNMATAEYRSWTYPAKLCGQLPRAAQESFSPLADGRIYQTYPEVKSMKVALLLTDWVAGRPAMEIEQSYSCLAGTIRGAGELFGWLAEATAAIADLLEFPKAQVSFLEALSSRLTHGVSADGLDLCRIRVRGFGRVHVQRLLDAGIDTVEGLVSAPVTDIEDALGNGLAAVVRRRAERLLVDDGLVLAVAEPALFRETNPIGHKAGSGSVL